MTLKVVVSGATGRMGKALIQAVHAIEGVELLGALEHENSEYIGQDAGVITGIGALNIPISADPITLLAHADCLLDFTTPQATLLYAELAAQARIVHIIGTTGLEQHHAEALKNAAYHARIVQSGNMSLGITLLATLVEQAAQALDSAFDLEIVEMHHRHKVDAPSGTAYLLGEAAAKGRKIDLESHSVRARDGHTGEREKGSIGFATLRGGSVIGDHSVILAGEGERIELTHKADDRTIFARGAVKAALWAYDKKPGLYTMRDVLNLS